MLLKRLKITQFKSYAGLEIELSPRLNCFVGLNGMGKTNLLDAVHFLCLAKSHLSIPDRNLVQHGASFFRLEGVFEKDGLQEKIVAKYLPGQPKIFERNGTEYPKLSRHIGQFPVVMIAPNDISLIHDGSEERRRFLDTTLSQISPDYLGNLFIYNNLLRQRNALLKQFADEKRFDAVLLQSLDRQMPAPADAIFQKRKTFTEAFLPLLVEFYDVISGSRERVALRYESDLDGADLQQVFEKNLEKDRALQRTSGGIHRDDLVLFLDDFSLKKFASQGQLKSFLLAMRLAQFELLRREKEETPILLLDDIFDKLDENRVRQLVALLLERDFGQIFITDTQRQRMEKIIASFGAEYRIFEVSESKCN